MKWLIKIIDWLERETWWRGRYKRITLPDSKVSGNNSCIECSAATGELQCNILKGRECPCEWNQCLKYKSK